MAALVLSNSITFDDFAEFDQRVKALYDEDPDRTRLVVKYKHPAQQMIARATNDRTVLMYKTDQAADVRKLDKLNLWLMARMCGMTASQADEEVTGGAAEEGGGVGSGGGGGGKKAGRRKKR